MEICGSAFSGCALLEEVQFQLPSNLAKIGGNVFRGCESLTEIYIVKSVSEISGNFLALSGVHHVVVDSGNRTFKTIHGFLLERDGTYIVCYFGVEPDVRIPSHIVTIGQRSFCRCQDVRSVTFEPGSKLTRVEQSAFFAAKSLQRVQFRSLLPHLEPCCFWRCEQLKEIIFQSRSRDSDFPDQFAEEVLSESILKDLIRGEGYPDPSSQ
jgi:hypothetical protein